MTQEDKELLRKDLCARLPYGVICTDNRHGDSRVFYVDAEDKSVYYTDFDEYGLIENCKPYLRSMSSMTEEEAIEYANCGNIIANSPQNNYLIPNPNCVDWLNAHHFDYRGLIEKGLALEAPEDMYKNN